MSDTAGDRWPATVELRVLLDALLDDAPSGPARLLIARAIGLAAAHELIPRRLAPSPSSLRPAPLPKEPHA